MITLAQYPDTIARIGVGKLNETQRKAHDFIVKFSSNYTKMAQLEKLMVNNETIRNTVNMWLEKVSKLDKPATPEKPAYVPPTPQFKEGDWVMYKGKPHRVMEVKERWEDKPQRYSIVDPTLRIPVRGIVQESALKKAVDPKRNLKAVRTKARGRKGAPILKGRKADHGKTIKRRTEKKVATTPKGREKTTPRFNVGDRVSAADYGQTGVVVDMTWDGWMWAVVVRVDSDGDEINYAEHALMLIKPKSAKAKPAKPVKAEKPAKPAKPVKAKLPTKAQKADAVYQAATKVPIIAEEVKHLKAFVGLVNKATTKEKIVGACTRLQKAFTTRKIRATSTLAIEMKAIESAYIDAAKKGPFRITVSEADLAKYVTIVGGQKVYKSVEIVSRYVGWADHTKTQAQVQKFLKEIKNAAGKVADGDPYAGRVKSIIRELELAAKKATYTFDLDQYDLSGLAGLLGCACQNKALSGLRKSRVKKSLAGLSGDEAAPVAEIISAPITLPTMTTRPIPAPVSAPTSNHKSIMSSHEVVAFDYPVFKFRDDAKTNDWQTLFGEPQRPFRAMISGGPGSGKSTLMIQLGNYLASNFGKVLYVSSEEYSEQNGPSKTLADKIERGGGAVRGFDFAHGVDQWDGHLFLMVDSVNHAKWTLAEMLEWSKAHPTVTILMVFQYTKGGLFKGNNEWPHEVDVVIKADGGIARTEKNRFRELSQIEVFKNNV